MSSVQKNEHRQKRKLLAAHRGRPRKSISKFAFENRTQRPLLNKMSYRSRRGYLKNLIKVAKLDKRTNEIAPIEPKKTENFITKNVKRALKISKAGDTAKRKAYKDLTYVALVARKAFQLIAKNKHAKI